MPSQGKPIDWAVVCADVKHPHVRDEGHVCISPIALTVDDHGNLVPARPQECDRDGTMSVITGKLH